MRKAEDKVFGVREMLPIRQDLKREGKTLVFTNGCFDILHCGHIDYLTFAREQGAVLLIGLNSDQSVRRNKGGSRPIVPEGERARVLAALEVVDYVVLFDEDEPGELIKAVAPDVLVKGEDWAHYVAGRDTVEAAGGKVVLAKMTDGCSSTNIIEKIKGSMGK